MIDFSVRNVPGGQRSYITYGHRLIALDGQFADQQGVVPSPTPNNEYGT